MDHGCATRHARYRSSLYSLHSPGPSSYKHQVETSARYWKDMEPCSHGKPYSTVDVRSPWVQILSVPAVWQVATGCRGGVQTVPFSKVEHTVEVALRNVRSSVRTTFDLFKRAWKRRPQSRCQVVRFCCLGTIVTARRHGLTRSCNAYVYKDATFSCPTSGSL